MRCCREGKTSVDRIFQGGCWSYDSSKAGGTERYLYFLAYHIGGGGGGGWRVNYETRQGN